ncbi:murein biosynthesis integral membrane protein MurJ [bacterium]|nr:murein biosynthesis integral membrane protein MurJ [bacterium]
MTKTNDNGFSQGVLKAASLIAIVTIFSKFIGFIRDIVIANNYGTSLVSDAYFYAYQIPALAIILLGGVGGPFHSATVSVFAKLIPNLNEKPSDRINKLYSVFISASLVLFTVLGVLLFIFADKIMALIISEGNPELIGLAAKHLQIMTPVFIIGGIIGIYYGILITYKRFMIPNISPILMSLAIIIMITLVKNDSSGYVLAAATTVGAVAQFMLQFPQIRKLGFRFKPNFDIKNNADFKNIMELLFPAALSSTVGQLHVYVDMFFASFLAAGAWTAIGYANRLFQFPVGILVTAFLVPLFPIFSKLVAEKDFDGIRNYFNKGVGVLFFCSIPIMIGIVTVGEDCIRLIFEHGTFDGNSTRMVMEALLFLSLVIIPYVFRDSITRVYYAFNDSKTPFVIAFSSIVLKYAVNFLFINVLGMQISGITLSHAVVTLFNAVLLGILIRKKIDLQYAKLWKNSLKMILSGMVSLAVCITIVAGFNMFGIEGRLFIAIKILAVSFACLTSYIGMNLILGMEYCEILWNRLKGKVFVHASK